MPNLRTRNPRSLANENDENSTATTTRMTRAKAATLHVDELSMPAKTMQTKKTTISTTTAATAARTVGKRNALGDVSNVTKVEVAGTKKAIAKPGLVSKAAQPSGIQKKTTTATSRTATTARRALSNKEPNKTVGPSAGAGTIPAKRKPPPSTSKLAPIKESAPVENEPARKKIHVEEPEKKKVSRTEAKENDAPSKAVKPMAEPPAPVVRDVVPVQSVYPPGVKDLDTEDLEDPLMVAEYATEIFEYLRDLECKSVPNPQYMSHQDDLEWKTRGILIDWLIEVHTRFHLLPETLFLAVNIIDRFLSEKVVQLDRLQLVGITAMFVASKYEEVLSPHIANFRHVADDGFTEAEILSAERFILSTLNYDLSYPNPMNFLRRISKADNYDIQSRTLGKYLMEISLLDHRFMPYRPSHVAAAAMYLARLILGRGEWDKTIAYYAGYTEEEIEPVFHLMVDYLARPVIHEAFFKKYGSKKFLKASILTRQWAKKNAVLYGVVDAEIPLDKLKDRPVDQLP
ncbi:G2/mitotic-specific cyclin-B [Neurospora crassa]|uniref:G2/mitotic-specific cyclin-B n=1 Tax=Neurospora crassa (strain ATCC 24698 / 74-OR23-1A / CBS 708.71 / DSM 1257 / FGSC 987) TaxID=367110 RepID=Q7SCX6_NEUCR|nr:G2/mitotic-specific cyclin-B [Neurospora crassa OR74A]EAA34615.1 G2/mitotic-specific cyclin-B [Neurospora crassa OR74A]KHE78952.1 G2/mitotic-specific cyclin-B [Neurospora crassa]|eukprot:XP_963851.1 G2/mitotic-specific cyclin-B [Neurospora crassa OR74A]